jgi:hypothetical protein
MGACVRSVAVLSNLYWKISLAGWGIFKWPQVGDFGWPSGEMPVLTINNLSTEAERSEQKAFGNILVGILGAVGNPTVHEPEISWPMTEQDALDIFAVVSFVHRKLDRSKIGCPP